MSIQVTCKSCLTRFNVSDKFAGKEGPCPKCKEKIKIPEKEEEVVIHAPKPDGPVDSKGKSISNPIVREEASFTKIGIGITVAAVVAAIGLALWVRGMEEKPTVMIVFGALLLAPPLTWAGYTFARDQELEPFRGKELWARIAICSLLFAGLWLLYAWVPAYVMDYKSVSEMPIGAVAVALAAIVAVGSTISVITFEFEFTGGLVHCALYFIATLLLALLAGIPMFQST